MQYLNLAVTALDLLDADVIEFNGKRLEVKGVRIQEVDDGPGGSRTAVRVDAEGFLDYVTLYLPQDMVLNIQRIDPNATLIERLSKVYLEARENGSGNTWESDAPWFKESVYNAMRAVLLELDTVRANA